MKKAFKLELIIWCIILLFVLISCKNKTTVDTAIVEPLNVDLKETALVQRTLSSEFKNYWYQGKAEISSFKLEQARYGEIREGEAVMVFVTESFLKDKQVKADGAHPTNEPVLKLNSTKNFNTGIYPYSIMESTFYPLKTNKHALKISCSVQEWCGQVYTQLNNRDTFEVALHSYFESEGDKQFELEKTHLENEIWTALRIDPKSLPTGELLMIPNISYSRLKHIDIKSYQAIASLNNNSYTIQYPELNRTLSIEFSTEAPFHILGWEETFISGFGASAQELTTKATLIKRINSDYWNKNHNSDLHLRNELQLN
ncbi:MAG: septum formation inhibitor Maf [Bacteroidetes bacterium MedPE-SWsnd-G2]|nr:MAG: septum formation inhibitor Maf [Bacteroidetes bacterium MedPE-SWsnd-G2]